MSIETARKRAKKFFKYHNLSLPVDIETLLSKYADVEETYIPMNGDAICINNKKHPHIIIKSNISSYRKRFTYAHELGHLQIPSHIGMISCTTELSEHMDIGAYYQMEQEANAFAAELLMPEDWLISLVSQFDTVKNLLEQVTIGANVSLTAAVYNLIPILPANYMFNIYNKIDDYSHIKYGSLGSWPIVLYNEEHDIDHLWIKVNCSDFEFIESDALALSIYKFKRILPDRTLEQIASEMNNYSTCKKICDKITNSSNISYAHLFQKLPNHLAPGIIIKLKCIDSGAYTYLYSKETYTRPYLHSESDMDAWFSENCLYRVSSSGIHVEINLWHFNTSFQMMVNTTDKRESKLILRNIITNLYYEPQERTSMFGRVNGIIGSLNGSISNLTQQQFYDILKQKFLSRTDLTLITNHKDFNQYLYRKIEELYDKK